MDDRLAAWAGLLDPRHTAVLVVDVQQFFTQVLGPRLFPPVHDVLAHLRGFLDHARAAGATIVRIQIIMPAETNSPVWRQQFGPAWETDCPLDPAAQGVRFAPGFEPQPGELLVTKHRYSAFFGTPLDSILRQRDIRTVIVTGLTTDVCVGTTARDAFQREYGVITLADCTAEQTRARHKAALQTLAATFGLVCASGDILQHWQVPLAAARE